MIRTTARSAVSFFRRGGSLERLDHQLWLEGAKLRAKGHDLDAEGAKLRAEVL
ncbi:MAG: hypothetical protein ACM3SY_12130 [Candidatus Omnitrophota bacterium]